MEVPLRGREVGRGLGRMGCCCVRVLGRWSTWRSAPAVLARAWLRVWRGAPMVRLGWAVAHYADRRSHCPLGHRRHTPATVRGGGCSVAKPIGGRSAPLIDDRPVSHIWIVPWFCPFDLHLLVLDVHVVLRHSPIHSGIVLKAEEAKSSSLLLLLVVHDDHLGDPSISAEEASQVRLSDT